MAKRRTKLFFLLFFLFLFDIIKPFGYAVCAEFLFLGIIFLALNARLSTAVLLSLLFGLFKDVFSFSARPLSIIEFPLICIMVQRLLPYLRIVGKSRYNFIAESGVIFLAIVSHIIFNCLFSGLFLPGFYLAFLIESFIIYLVAAELAKKFLMTAVVSL